MTAVNAEGNIAWRVPLGSYDELEAQGLHRTGAANMGGSIATAGGLVFIGATTDSKFRAFDSRTGNELWVTRLDATGRYRPRDLPGTQRQAVCSDRRGRDQSLPYDRRHGGSGLPIH